MLRNRFSAFIFNTYKKSEKHFILLVFILLIKLMFMKKISDISCLPSRLPQ